MNYTIIDCETSALPIEQLNIPEFEASKVLKDETKIAADLAKKKAEWLESCALRADCARVLVIGLLDQDGVEMFIEGDEKGVLDAFWKAFDANTAPMVGHFIKGFDMPFLIRRSWMKGVKVPAGIMRGRYLNDRFIDTMEAYACGTRDTISLDNLSKALAVGAKSGNGKDFSALYQTDREAALKYLSQDLLLVKQCAFKMGLI